VSSPRDIIEHRRAGKALAGIPTVLCPECHSLTAVPVICQLVEGISRQRFMCDACGEDLEVRVAVERPAEPVFSSGAQVFNPEDYLTKDEVQALISGLETTVLDMVESMEQRLSPCEHQWEQTSDNGREVLSTCQLCGEESRRRRLQKRQNQR
jgi:hypothetical protein